MRDDSCFNQIEYEVCKNFRRFIEKIAAYSSGLLIDEEQDVFLTRFDTYYDQEQKTKKEIILNRYYTARSLNRRRQKLEEEKHLLDAGKTIELTPGKDFTGFEMKG